MYWMSEVIFDACIALGTLVDKLIDWVEGRDDDCGGGPDGYC